MFKYLGLKEQLRDANTELARLKARVGELPKQENIEGEEIEQKTIIGEVEQTKADLDYMSIMTGVDL